MHVVKIIDEKNLFAINNSPFHLVDPLLHYCVPGRSLDYLVVHHCREIVQLLIYGHLLRLVKYKACAVNRGCVDR